MMNLAKAAVDWDGSRNQRSKETASQLVTGPSIRIAVDNTIKAWIPQNTWWKIGAQYDWASTQTVNNKKVDDEAFNRALRMSKIDKTNDAVKFVKGAKQLLIPTDLVNDRALDFQVDCKKDWKLLSDTKIVNYNGWKKNVIGKPQ
ncbi:hypothetical protein CBS470a_009049 [Colletotrichum nupharicola]|nr:hypothetical protein CBS470a_009049 [Colletotrichum nupharicola]